MHFSAPTLAILVSLVQAQTQVHRIVGADNVSQEPYILTPATMSTLDDPTDPTNPDNHIIGRFTSFSVIEGTGCPAGTFSPQPVEAGKTINTYVSFESFVFNSTTSEAPVTCSLKYEFEFTYPEGGSGVVYTQLITDTESKYEENDTERSTNFNLGHNFNVKAGQLSFEDNGITYNVITDGPMPLNIGAYLPVSGTPGEKDTGYFSVDYSMYTSFGPGEMKATRATLGFGLWE